MRPTVTLSDVARRAHVSPTTASYVINGRAAQMRISVKTQRRVLDAATALDYRPNRSARNLRTATTATIGLVSDFLATSHAAGQMLMGAGAAARLADRLLVIGETEGDPAVEARLVEEMLDRQVDGIVYARQATSYVTVPRSLERVRVVLLNCLERRRRLPAVLPDDLEGGRTAAAALVDVGIVEEVYVVGEDTRPDAVSGPLRVEGVRRALAEAGHEVAGTVPCELGVTAAHGAVGRWLASGARPSALVCLDDRVAMGSYQALAERGLEVPRDVSVVSFDGSELASWLRPPVSSVVLPYAELGSLAVRTLTNVHPSRADVVRVPMQLAPRASIRRGGTTGAGTG